MNNIIYNYLNKNYSFTSSTYVRYVLFDKIDKTEVRISDVFKVIIKIFEISIDEVNPIFDAWADKKAIEFNNRITDYKFAFYKKYGVEIEPTELNVYGETLIV